MKAVAGLNLGQLAAYLCSSQLEFNRGGGCVGIYTLGRYSSMKLDFVHRLRVTLRKLTSSRQSSRIDNDYTLGMRKIA